jgi:hypothetical protein
MRGEIYEKHKRFAVVEGKVDFDKLPDLEAPSHEFCGQVVSGFPVKPTCECLKENKRMFEKPPPKKDSMQWYELDKVLQKASFFELQQIYKFVDVMKDGKVAIWRAGYWEDAKNRSLSIPTFFTTREMLKYSGIMAAALGKKSRFFARKRMLKVLKDEAVRQDTKA